MGSNWTYDQRPPVWTSYSGYITTVVHSASMEPCDCAYRGLAPILGWVLRGYTKKKNGSPSQLSHKLVTEPKTSLSFTLEWMGTDLLVYKATSGLLVNCTWLWLLLFLTKLQSGSQNVAMPPHVNILLIFSLPLFCYSSKLMPKIIIQQRVTACKRNVHLNYKYR